MSFETIPPRENCKSGEIGERTEIGKNRARLLALEKTDRFVFHGSPDIISVMEPRQAYYYDLETHEKTEDGKPAIFATPNADVAIFRALITEKTLAEDSTSSFGVNDGVIHFSATQNLLDHTRGKLGRVYVFDKSKFHTFEGIQCRSEEKIIPVEVVEVGAEDLPDNIDVVK